MVNYEGINQAVAFYILSGKDYIDQGSCSAMSVKEHMPDMKCYLFTPDEDIENVGAFDEIISLPPRQSELWYLDCVHYLRLSLDILRERRIKRLLFLDSDTLVVEPCYEIFELLNRFDLAAAHSPGRVTCPTVRPIPDCFPELNIGVMVLYNHWPLRNFVSDWEKQYEQYQEIYGNNDQGSLRETLWTNSLLDIKFYILPPEYNCRPLGTGVFLKGKARILHTNSPYIEEFAQTVNETTGMRFWKP